MSAEPILRLVVTRETEYEGGGAVGTVSGNAESYLRALDALGVRVAALDSSACERPDDVLALTDTLRDCVREALTLLEAIQAVRSDDDDASNLADLCFAGTIELRSALRLVTVDGGQLSPLSRCESALRKLRRALRVVLGRSVADLEGVEDELTSALMVRRSYAAFRRGLRRADAETEEAVLTAVRYAASAFATLLGSPALQAMRESDRAAFRALRERALAWGRSRRAVPEGLSLLEDVWTFADLLRDINWRQELKTHDAQLIAELRAAPVDRESEWLVRLDPLEGYDAELDRIIEQGRRRASDTFVRDALARLAALS